MRLLRKRPEQKKQKARLTKDHHLMMTMLMLTRVGREEHGSQIQTAILQLLYPLTFYVRAFIYFQIQPHKDCLRWIKYFKS